MYKINKQSNSIEKIDKKTFAELGFRERQNLQEWIAKEPTCLGEELLIIQKEFDGFDGTRERFDLLALDDKGALVIIENKLDDSGRDVVWQAIKYASYCSSLTEEQIINIYQKYLDKTSSGTDAREKITEFFDATGNDDIILNNRDQRIILIAANFKPEVTSAALWLLNHNISLQCFKVTPYGFGEELFLNIDQIIPIEDAKDYMIQMAEKEQEQKSSEQKLQNRHIIRYEFWKKLLDAMNKSSSSLFANISPSRERWISAGSGMRACPFIFVFSKKYGRIELYIDRGEQDENEFIFNELLKYKSDIESKFDDVLVWEQLPTKRACRIKYEKPYDGYNKEVWNDMVAFMVDVMCRFEKAMKPYIEEVSKMNAKQK